MRGGDHLVVGLEAEEPVVVIAAAGEMDAASIGRLEEAVETAVRDHDRHVVLDLDGVSFIDSTGITALVSAMRRLNRARRRMALAFGPATPVARALELTGLDHTFECHADSPRAVAELAGAPLIGR
jgi:anti-sigma B factor antagonist